MLHKQLTGPLVSSAFSKSLLEAHLRQWFAETMPSLSESRATRFESLNLAPIARVSGLSECELRAFALGQSDLPFRGLANLIVIIKCLGYIPLLSGPDW